MDHNDHRRISSEFRRMGDSQLEALAKEYRGPLGEIYRGKLRELPITIGASDIPTILRSGEYKNAFQFPIMDGGEFFSRTGGESDIALRSAAEKNIFGLGENTPASARPRYGILSDRHSIEPMYGDHHIVLSNRYEKPVTFTNYDSLDPKAILIPGRTNVPEGAVDQAVRNYLEQIRFEAEKELLFRNTSGAVSVDDHMRKMASFLDDPGAYRSSVRDAVTSGGIDKPIRYFGNPYVEAQIHGPIDMDKDVRGYLAPNRAAAAKLQEIVGTKPVSILHQSGRIVGPTFGLSNAVGPLGILSSIADMAAQATGGKPSYMDEAENLQNMRAEQFRRGDTGAPPATRSIIDYLKNTPPEA